MIGKFKQMLAFNRASQDVVRLFSEEPLSTNEEHGIRNRCERSTIHHDGFVATAQLFSDLGVFSGDEELSSLARSSNDARRGLTKTALPVATQSAAPARDLFGNTRARRLWPVYAAAAGLLVTVALFYGEFYPPTDSSITSARYVTQTGEQKSIQLPDGSKVMLNTSSELITEFSSRWRKLTLLRGEVYFDVAPEADRPFSVDLGERIVTVLGTQFDIFREPDRITLAVSEGEVLMHRTQDQINVSAPVLSPPGDEGIYLEQLLSRRVQAGTVVQLDVLQNTATAYRPKDIGDMATWRSGVLQFNAAHLSDVVRELNRYSAKKILIEDASVMNLELFATVRLDRINEAISILENTMPIRVVRHVDRIVIHSSNRAHIGKNR